MNPEVSDIPAAVVDFYQALDRVKRLQTNDFRGILRVMSRKPVIIRLLDAPLHEFLPPYDELLTDLATLRATGASHEDLAEREEFLNRVDSSTRVEPHAGPSRLPPGTVLPGDIPHAGGGHHHGRRAA